MSCRAARPRLPAPRARWCLGRGPAAGRRDDRAAAPPPSGPDAAAAARLRDEALKLFKQIASDTDAKLKRDGKLGERDAWLRLQAALRVLQVYQQLQRPNDLLAEADQLRDRHRGTVDESLLVSSTAWSAPRCQKERQAPRWGSPSSGISR